MNRKITSALALFAVAGFLTLSGEIKPASATTWNLTLYGSYTKGWGFTPDSMASPGPSISVNEGDIVNLTLISQDNGIAHQFYVDYNGNHMLDVGEPASGYFTTTVTLQFTASINGTFTYYCSVHPDVMYGGFTVVPEFSPVVVLTVFMIATLLVAVALRKLGSRNSVRVNLP